MSRELILHVNDFVIPAALSILPGRMDSPPARAMLLAIGLQESGFVARQQGGTRKRPGEGPAKSFWQFERNGGVQELLASGDSFALLIPVCETLCYPEMTKDALHEAMEHNDTLACCMARLLLWKDPRPMPNQNQPNVGWNIYHDRWRPGKPHPDSWPANFARAWAVVLQRGE